MGDCSFPGVPRVISTTGEYALRAAVYLAQQHPAPQTSARIAAGTRVPPGYLAKILQAMVRGALIHSQRGLHGGFALADAPGAISVLRVLESVDAGPQRIVACPLGLKGHTVLCPVHHLVDAAVENAQRAFAAATLEELLRSTGGSVPLCDTPLAV